MTPGLPPARRGALIAVAGLAFIAAMTLTPHPENIEQAAETPLWCVQCGDLAGMDIILNVILFVPFAAGLRLAGWSRWRVVLTAFLTSLAIEVTQYFFLPGRDATLGDLITNTTGGLVGVVLAEHYPLFLRPDRRHARRLTAAGGAIWLGVQLVTGWGMGLALPARPYWGQIAPELGQFDRFHGTVTEARLAGEPMPSAELKHSPEIRQRLLSEEGGLAARAISGLPPERLAPIVSVFDSHQQEITLLGQRGTDLIFRINTRAWSLGLRGPALALNHALPADSGRAFSVSGRLSDGFLEATADTGAGPVSRRLGLSPSWGWSLLLPFDNYALGGNARFLTILWLSGLLLPLGYWTARASPPTNRPPGLALLGGLIAAGLAGTAACFHLPPVHWSEWVAAGAGAGAGWTLAASPEP